MPWYAAVVKAQSEIKAAAHLMQRGIEVMLPCEWSHVRINRHTKARKYVRKPIFGRYVFINTVDTAALLAMRYAENFGGANEVVQRIVSCGGSPQQMPDEAVSEVRRLLHPEPLQQRKKRLRAGEIAVYRHRVFGKQEVTLTSHLSKTKSRVVLNWLNRIEAVVDTDDLEPIVVSRHTPEVHDTASYRQTVVPIPR